MRFGVLGPLGVWAADGSPVRVPEAKVRALLAVLLANAGQVVSADRLVDLLWGDEPPGNPAGALHTKVWHLRRALDAAEPGARELVGSRAPGYLLASAETDAETFSALLTRAGELDDPGERTVLLTEALALWRGPAYAEFADEEFARAEITRLDEQHLAALEELAAARLELGEHALLTGELADLVVRHPLRERLRALQMRALYRAGRQSEALAAYTDLRDRLRDELGLDPSPDLAALQQAILDQESTALGTTESTKTNLPAALTELIGRTRAVEQVHRLMTSGRLTTLTGPGGVGKTRLAIETAARAATTEDVWLVEFATLDRTASVDHLADLISTTLGLRDDTSPHQPPAPSGLLARAGSVDRVAAALRGRRTLLVLDNCEHVIGPAAELVAHLLEAAPRLRVLATGQEPLGIPGERLWPVPPLDLPERDDAPQESSAVRLFLARAKEAAPGFELTRENADAVGEICRQLDGIPLALELAATRLRVLGVDVLRDRLDDRFRVLASGRRGGPARQQTLRAMIDWSWELLTAAERAVLRRLAVHADGCTLEAAEEICAGGGVAAADVVDLLARLVDRSLVFVTERPDAGGPRYRLLESVSAYCHDRLDDAGETDAVRRRHDTYYVTFAERAAGHLRGHGQRAWLGRLDAETAGLRATLECSARRGDAALALRLVNALGWYWFLRGRLGEAERSLTLALSTAPDQADPRLRAEAAIWRIALGLHAADGPPPPDELETALAATDVPFRPHAEWILGFSLFGYGDVAISEDLVDRALTGFRAADDQWGIASALAMKSRQAVLRGDFAAAERDGAESIRLFDGLGDRWSRLAVSDALGTIAEVTGDYERAAHLHREGLQTAEDLGLWPEVCRRLTRLGRIALLDHDYARSADLHERARRLAAEHSDEAAEESAELGLGLVARRQGRFDAAEAHLLRWLDWCREREGHHGVALILAELGFIAEQRGDAATALKLHREGLDTARLTGDPRAVALAFEGLAGAHALDGDHLEAARLLGAASTLRESVGAPLPPAERADVDRITKALRTALPDDAFPTPNGGRSRAGG